MASTVEGVAGLVSAYVLLGQSLVWLKFGALRFGLGFRVGSGLQRQGPARGLRDQGEEDLR